MPYHEKQHEEGYNDLCQLIIREKIMFRQEVMRMNHIYQLFNEFVEKHEGLGANLSR